MNERQRKEVEVLNAALEIESAPARAAYLDQVCAGDPALRKRVERLLRVNAEADDFFAAAQPSLPARSAADATAPGSEHVGRYKLLQKIGEGGCGVVYMAEQTEPVRRRVALKIIKLGMDTRAVIARFEAERQALALMDHPNIARVLDAGATDTGRPFFVMELVRGIKITDFCDQNSLATGERLKLFMHVCHAVQHAHQKGIIHRDLKPSNILVTAQDDGTPVPKVIDFGIAKATTALQLTNKTLFTQFEMLIGTPAYMSPEQAAFNATDVDTRTDIYALGVLLYELLTGRTPFDSETLLKSGLDAMRKTIRETEPTRPSTRLRTLAAVDLTEVARRRQAEPPKLLSLVHGDLDWIVLKALEKDRTRRYETANAFAADVQRFLRDEPVMARPPSAVDALRKMVRRNKLAFAAGSAVVAALFVGLGTATLMFFKERAARQRAVAAEDVQRQLRRESDAFAEESRQRLVRMNVAAGGKLVEDGDALAALPWFAEALRLDEGDAAREDAHRRRFASVLRAAPQLAQLWVHGDFVHCAEFSPDGTRVVTASNDRMARVWDARTGEPVTPPLRGDRGCVLAWFTPDGRRVLTTGWDGSLQFWDAQTGEASGPVMAAAVDNREAVAQSADGRWVVGRVPDGAQLFDAATGAPLEPKLIYSDNVRQLRFHPEGGQVAAVGLGSGVRLWDALSGRSISNSLARETAPSRIAFSPDGRRIATVFGTQLGLWDLARSELVWPWRQPGGLLNDCRFSPDGRWLAVGNWTGTARVLDANTGQTVGGLMHHRGAIGKCLFSPDGQRLATSSWDGTARLWHARTGEPASPYLRHAGALLEINFSPDGTRLLVSGQDHTVRLWLLPTNSPARLTLGHRGGVRHAQFSPNGRWLLTASRDHQAGLWETATGQRRAWLAHGASLRSAAFSPDGKYVVTGGADGAARVWDAAAGVETIPAVRHAKGVRHVEFSPDGGRFLTASDDGTAHVWQIADGSPAIPALTHDKAVVHAAFSRDGRRIVTASDTAALIWDAQSGARVGPALAHDKPVQFAAFSPDGRRVVTTAYDGTRVPRAAQVWDTATGQAAGPPLSHLEAVLHVEFSPDGSRLVTAGQDNAAMIWDAATSERLTPPLRHASPVNHASFSPDSRLVLTASADGTARVWDAATGEPITPPLAHGDDVSMGAWSPDGREVITASTDGSARVWDVSPMAGSLAELQCRAELLAAHRLAAHRGLEPLTAGEMNERWQALRGK